MHIYALFFELNIGISIKICGICENLNYVAILFIFHVMCVKYSLQDTFNYLPGIYLKFIRYFFYVTNTAGNCIT